MRRDQICKHITLQYSYQKLQNVEHQHPINDVIQNNFREIWAVKDHNLCVLYGPIKKQMFHNTSLLHISIVKKSVCHDYVWYDVRLGKKC